MNIQATQGTPSIFNATDILETVRLSAQHHLLTDGIGGIFPPSLDLTNVYDMLDVNCGVGKWTMDAARHLEASCTGIESHPELLRDARMQLETRVLADLVTFEAQDIRQSLTFPDASFDLVHLTCLVERIPTEQWSNVLRECFRVLRKGGFLLWTETEWPTMSSCTAEALARYVTEAWWKAGFGFSCDGRTLGVLHTLPTRLREAGECDVHVETHLLDFSAWQPHYPVMAQYFWTSFITMQPFLTKMGYGSQKELYTLYDQLAVEMSDTTFQGAMSVVRLWGQKGAFTQPHEPPCLPMRFPLIG